MSDEAALLKAVITYPNEDTPRLLYADWLEENNAPVQAAWIRNRCRFEACSFSDDAKIDLLEEGRELNASCRRWMKLADPPLPPGFAHTASDEDDPDEAEHARGFLYGVDDTWYPGDGPTEETIGLLCDNLLELIATTTARFLHLRVINAVGLRQLLAAPGVEGLDGISIHNEFESPAEGDRILDVIARSPSTHGFRRLELNFETTSAGVRSLAAAGFDNLESLDFPRMNCNPAAAAMLARAAWLPRLRHVSIPQSNATATTRLLEGLASVPRLESVRLESDSVAPYRMFARGFPSLGHLSILDPRDTFPTAALAKAAFPKLAQFRMNNLSQDDFTALLGAPWFGQLRLLHAEGRLMNENVVALAKSPLAATLRMLTLGDAYFGKTGVAAIGSGTFSNLTTLDLNSSMRRRIKPADIVRFAGTLQFPLLKHLDLSGWELGNAGAKALAANPSLANLTRLSVCNCDLTDIGFNKLVASPHLQGLVELNATGNRLRKAASLADRDLLPRLAAADLTDNPIIRPAVAELDKARRWVVQTTHE